jgi:hypothetical protein
VSYARRVSYSGAYLRLGEAVETLPLVTAVAKELRHLGAGTLSAWDVALTLSIEALVFRDFEFEVFETFVGEGLRVLHNVAAAAFDPAEVISVSEAPPHHFLS